MLTYWHCVLVFAQPCCILHCADVSIDIATKRVVVTGAAGVALCRDSLLRAVAEAEYDGKLETPTPSFDPATAARTTRALATPHTSARPLTTPLRVEPTPPLRLSSSKVTHVPDIGAGDVDDAEYPDTAQPVKRLAPLATSRPTALSRYTVTGMTCGSCVSAINRTVSALAGVESVTVALLSERMEVRYDAALVTDKAIAATVTDAGYECSLLSTTALRVAGERRDEPTRRRAQQCAPRLSLSKPAGARSAHVRGGRSRAPRAHPACRARAPDWRQARPAPPAGR